MPTILVVDDEPDILSLLQFKLKKEGYTVLTAADGPTGLAAAQTHLPDVIVLDVMMPKMDGFEVLDSLKRRENTGRIPVIMLTAKTQSTDIARGAMSGADLYITKPFVPDDLVAAVRRVLPRPEAE
ncbi:MAG: response regulator [Armatimonadetes bacterium]|nr:response regulator [Armatimonadota bacterium]